MESSGCVKPMPPFTSSVTMRLQFLGFPDGGLDRLLNAHWQRSHPERSQTTGASDPPYDNALEPDVPYDGSDLRRELVRLLRETDPTIVALPDPLDEHPDHRATGIFTLLALNDWLGETSTPKAAKRRLAMPQLLTYLIHWENWPPDSNAEDARARPQQRISGVAAGLATAGAGAYRADAHRQGGCNKAGCAGAVRQSNKKKWRPSWRPSSAAPNPSRYFRKPSSGGSVR